VGTAIGLTPQYRPEFERKQENLVTRPKRPKEDAFAVALLLLMDD
jgi:hypothetical protein